MRAKKLTLTAFGPYATQTEIDFTSLGKSGVYIITGDTGAGKTTIFDGISFALFGKPSGSVREGKTLRSKYASPETPTFVELVFELKGKEYTVKRNPEYEVFSKRAKGLVTKSPDAELLYPDGRVVYKVSAVDKAMGELLGITKDQFNQIAMIAQGDFLKLLLADTDERSKVFRKIFKTEQFDALQNRLAEEYRACANELNELNSHCDSIFEGLPYQDEVQNLTDSDRVTFLAAKTNEDRALYQSLKKERDFLTAEQTNLSHSLGELEGKKNAQEELTQKEAAWANLKMGLPNLVLRVENAEKQKGRKETLTAAIAGEKAREKDYSDRETLKKEVFDLTNAALSLAQKRKEAEEKLAALKEGAALLQKQMEEEKEVPTLLFSAQTAAKEEEEKEQTLRSLFDSRNALKKEEQTKAALLNESENLIAEYQKASEEYSFHQGEFLRAQAGILAESLVDGTPCPVCGSLTHPSPAKKREGVKSEEELKTMKEFRDSLETKSREKSAEAAEFAAKLTSQWENLRLSLEKIGCAEENLSLEIEKTEKAKQEREGEVIALNKRKNALLEASGELENIRRDTESANAETERLRGELQEKNTLLAQKNGELERLSSLRFSSLAEAAKEIRAWQEEEQKISREMEESKKALEDAKNALSRADGERAMLKKSAEGFSFEEFAAKKERQAEIATKLNELEERMKEVVEQGKAEKDALSRLTELMKRKKELTARYQVIAPLYATASGTLGGKEKIRLETFVQTQYFDRVISRANGRLYKMTNGQFELVRREVSSSMRSQTGLELDVVDYLNDSTRPASTLSGGESFLASLALALGLSDEIQSNAGGVQIDSMFVDEGFGSLSDEALSAAIDTLESVSGGNVLIGIISHVEALRERIDKQIVVKKGKEGSSVKVIV